MNREQMVEQMLSCDKNADGQFIVAVRTTRIYCLPSCRPPRKPKPENVDFFQNPQEAQAHGFRACKLCRPDDFYNNGGRMTETLLERLAEAIARNPAAYRDVTSLATAGGVSPRQLYKLFRNQYQKTPGEWLTQARLDAACQALLEGDKPVAQVAFEVGFESLSAFNENFRKYTGLPPAQYRRLREEVKQGA